MIDPKLDNFWPQTSRENYVYQNWLQIWDCARNWKKDRDGLINQIVIRDKIIVDLKEKLQEENENSQSWKIKMLEEEKEKELARENEEKTRKGNLNLIQASFDYKGKISSLNDDLSKLTQQKKELCSELEEIKKINHDNEHK